MQLKYQVETIMRTVPLTRNNDVTLMIELWKKYYPDHIKRGAELGIWLSSLHHLPTHESIKRIRAIIQNTEGRMLPTLFSVRKARKIKESVWLEYVRLQSEFKRI